MNGWKMNFLLGRPIFTGELLVFREGNFPFSEGHFFKFQPSDFLLYDIFDGHKGFNETFPGNPAIRPH